MTGLWIALSLKKSVDEIRAILAGWFGELLVANWDKSSTERVAESLNDPMIARADVLFQLETNESDFPTEINIDRFPGPQDEAVLQPVMFELARRFAGAFNCRALCAAGDYGPDEAPFWAIVWDGDRSFLADASESHFWDPAGGPVRILREIALPPFRLDEAGRLADQEQ
jgi:hypothetical protein